MTEKESRTSYHKKPENLTIDAWQRALRKQFVQDRKQSLTITRVGAEHPVFTEYSVENPATGGRYKVALHSLQSGENFCACGDFRTNALGTCKHIEAVLHEISNDKQRSGLLNEQYRSPYTAVYVRYGEDREVRIRIGTENAERFLQLAREYFDHDHRLRPESLEYFDEFLQKARSIGNDFRCYEDTLQFVDAIQRRKERCAIVERISRDENYFDSFLKVPLYPFQREGVLFAAKSGRCLIADEMGLGKTIQSIAAAELLRRECRARRTLIVCPTSLKYQWKHEIEKFAGHDAAVIEGTWARRHTQYQSASTYTIAHYNIIGADLAAINDAQFDTVILDEAQRIKNWSTKLARDAKRIVSRYAIVLTGTPVENKLEELYSIVSFIDPYKLGPVHRFLDTHRIKDESGKITGYRELNKIQEILADIVIRRRKKDVLRELPERTDKNVFVIMTKEQTSGHQQYGDTVARLVNKWKRIGFLDEKDRKRLMTSLNCMRMLADSTYILDQVSRHDTKIDELMHIVDDVLSGDEKIVIFSQWERMTRLVQQELEKRGAGFVSLHGGVPSKKRKDLLSRFRDDSACRVFLSTDAGGVGLNLQNASIVVNLDLPWNPAVLEQRIARVYRHGQGRRVNVVNLISRGSIEERMQDVLKFKSSLFAGIFDGGESEVHMGESSFKRFMHDVEQIAHVSSGVPLNDDCIAASSDATPPRMHKDADNTHRAEMSPSDMLPHVPQAQVLASSSATPIVAGTQDADVGSKNSSLIAAAVRVFRKLFSVFR